MNKFVPLSRSNERSHANLISHSDERRPTTSGSWTRFREDKIMIFFCIKIIIIYAILLPEGARTVKMSIKFEGNPAVIVETRMEDTKIELF